MAQYTVEGPGGKQVTLEGDTPPTEADLNQVFGQLGGESQAPADSKSVSWKGLDAAKRPGTLLGVGEVVPGVARGVVQGGQEMLNTAANLNELVGSPAGKGPRDLVNASRQALDMLIPPADSVAGKIAEGLGQLPGMVTTYGAIPEAWVIPAAAVLGAINAPDHDAESMIKSAATNAAVMGLLGISQKVAAKSIVKGAGMAALTTGGAAALSGGSGKDVIAQSALGAGFSMYPQESQARLRKDYEVAKKFSEDPRGNVKGMFDVLKEDPIQRNMRIINEREAKLKEQAAGVNTQAAQDLRTRTEQARNLTKEDQKAIDGQKTVEQKRADSERKRVETERANAITKLQDDADTFTKNLPDTAEAKAHYIQDKYKPFFKQATDQYGPQLDQVASKIGEISSQNAFDILGSARDKSINDYGSSDTTFAKKITKLQEKYDPDKVIMNLQDKPLKLSEVSPEQAKAYAKMFGKTFVDKYNAAIEPVNFKDFYADVKNLLSSMKPEEHASSLLRREVGDYIAKVEPSFQELQAEYSHIVSFRQELASVFHPYDGPAALKEGEKWLTQFGQGREAKMTNAERGWLRFMEQGFEGNKIKMQGIGSDVSDTFSKLGDRIDYIKREIANSKDPIYSKYAMEIADIAQSHARNMADLESKRQLTIENLNAEMYKIKGEIEHTKALAEFDIQMKKRIYEKGRQRTHKLDESRKRIEGLSSSIGMGMAGSGLWKASRLFRAGLLARKSMRIKGAYR